MLRRSALPGILSIALLLPACGGENDAVLADAAHDGSASAAAKQLLLARARELSAAAVMLHDAAPTPAPAGWSAAADPAAVAAMKAAWKQARAAYQSLEGATDLLFSDLDLAIDTRYDDALALGPDPDLFDGQGFVGLHAIERVLWSDAIPANVVAFESSLAGYAAPAFPATTAQAAAFKDELCARLVSDAAALEARFAAAALDSPAVYEASIHLVKGQVAKIQEAGAGKDESRYAGHTLADMRANVTTAAATHAVFRGWLLTKQGGAHVDGEIAGGFARLEQAYAALPGDALPAVPSGWSSIDPTGAMRATPFGALFQAVGAESDDTRDGSLAHSMGEAVGLLGIAPVAAPDAGAAAPARPHDAT